VIRCCTATFAKKVRLLAGSNIADRCFILPGVTVGEEAVLGSGTMAPEDFYFAPKSVWVGCTLAVPNCLDKGDEGREEGATELKPSPFGDAFYLRNASYFVFPIPLLVVIHIIWQALVSGFLAQPIITTLLIVAHMARHWATYPIYSFFFIFLACFIIINFVTGFIAILVDIGAKWMLLGRRKPGEYGWNQNSYCQRWQLYLLAQRITHSGFYGRGVLNLLLGSAYIVWYFRSLGCTIGKNVCLYPTGGDPMMTEPDLVTIGDNVAINDASVVGHINSRGKFRLNNIKIESGATLRSWSRLLSGAEMEVGSKLLEHTLIMGGDNVGAFTVWQGWPASLLYSAPK